VANLGLCRLVLAGGVTLFALSDMMLYNRRRRNEYYKLQMEHREAVLAAAKAAQAEGTATPTQLRFLRADQEQREQEKERKAKGWFTKVREELMGGLQKEDIKGGTMGIGVNGARDQAETQRDVGVVLAVGDVMDSAKEAITRDVPTMPMAGGPLDQHAAKAVQDAEKATKSWWSWVTGR